MKLIKLGMHLGPSLQSFLIKLGLATNLQYWWAELGHLVCVWYYFPKHALFFKISKLGRVEIFTEWY